VQAWPAKDQRSGAAGVGGMSPVLLQMWEAVIAVPVQMWFQLCAPKAVRTYAATQKRVEIAAEMRRPESLV
jgi:hypothetical protein